MKKSDWEQFSKEISQPTTGQRLIDTLYADEIKKIEADLQKKRRRSNYFISAIAVLLLTAIIVFVHYVAR
jgi:bacteriorhodopsin